MALTRDRLTVLSKRIVAVFEDVYLKAISILAEIWQIDPGAAHGGLDTDDASLRAGAVDRRQALPAPFPSQRQ